MINTKVHMFEK